MNYLLLCFGLWFATTANAQTIYLLKPDRVFDGETMHDGWVVRIFVKTSVDFLHSAKQIP